MIKSVFVGLNLDKTRYGRLSDLGANHLIVAGHSVTSEKWGVLEKSGCDLAISINTFDHGGCPCDPRAKQKLERRVKAALGWEPKEIWLDHFRFDGRWEAVDTSKGVYKYKMFHKPCKWCEGKNRSQEIAKLAKETRRIIPAEVKVGYFAVPFVVENHTGLVEKLGHDHRLLGNIFDMASPMLYHRMIKRPVGYISEYTSYLGKITARPVLPIVQIKDMPDDLPDKLSWQEVKSAYSQARKSPSIGASIFMWEHAIEKNKVGLIKELFSLS